jgi:PhzF family phenazine biosynthesis protein
VRQYIVDAFTDRVFHGNQAAICILDEWPAESLMMDITRENNFSETAFAVREGDGYHLRWFTPGGEIDLCGHATLACAYVLLRFYIPEARRVAFDTLGGKLVVTRQGDLLEMEFPAYALEKVEVTSEMAEALGAMPREAYMGRDLLCVLDDERDVRGLSPDMEKVKSLDGLLLHVTAPSRDVDCVSRSFAPKLQVDEDPVCGSGHCHIAPYWSKRLGKDKLVAYQASDRGGTLYCRMDGQKVYMAGRAALYSVGDLALEGVGAA